MRALIKEMRLGKITDTEASLNFIARLQAEWRLVFEAVGRDRSAIWQYSLPDSRLLLSEQGQLRDDGVRDH
jgi:hypothetical protein